MTVVKRTSTSNYPSSVIDIPHGDLDATYDILLSNIRGVGSNDNLVRDLLQQVNIDKLNLTVLDEVYQSFEKTLGFTPVYNEDEFKDLKVNEVAKQPVLFDYDGKTWNANIVWHKWRNIHDKSSQNIWRTYSIKLPNDGYLYHWSYERSDATNHYLKDESHVQLEHALNMALNFFDDDNASIGVFYLTKRSRMNIKVMSQKYKAWLQLTFEYGYPKQSAHTGWYTKEQMKQLLRRK